MKRDRSMNQCAQILKAMSDRTRLLMLKSLFRGEKCGTEISTELHLPQPQVAHHLGILKTASLVEGRREGQRVYYKLCLTVHQSVRQGGDQTINLGCCRISFKD